MFKTLITYESLDRIADSVNPTLCLLALLLPSLPPYRSPVLAPWIRIAGAILCVGVAYAGQAFDRLTDAWSSLLLDYSGHSAVCVALLVSLAQLSRRWLVASVGIGAAYAGLMIYQAYHTLADIVTTSIPIGLACILVWQVIWCHARGSRGLS